ncbi:MAG: adenylosuccinate synthase [Candidatus Thorarchaeota archaeon]|nr:adenylosuccinate synthase [Candidatus Thorarchaeota archaeon]
MVNLVAVGLQWGDEGKGKIIDTLSGHFDIVARFQGGSNAGHTVVTDGITYKFRIIPTGAVRGKTVVIGNGVVVDPAILLDEIMALEQGGIKVDLVLSERAHVITPFQIQIDGLMEEAKGASRVGTTKRGIGPTYADKISRIGLRVGDIHNDDRNAWGQFEKATLSRIEKQYGAEPVKPPTEVFESLSEIMHKLAPYISDSGAYLRAAIQSGKNVLFEGAQGTLLDIDHGTYPYVTSSNCVSGAAATGTGVPPTALDHILGVTKAYTTRVGAGPFPTELSDDVGQRIQEQGGEFGTVTGRPRRCGWLDIVALRYAVQLNGAEFLAVTKVDVLSGIDPLKFAVAYEIEGVEISDFPVSIHKLQQVTPIYEELPGWKEFSSEDWTRMAKAGYDDLPSALREYLSVIERYTGSKIAIVSTGPSRTDTLFRPEVSDLFTDDETR